MWHNKLYFRITWTFKMDEYYSRKNFLNTEKWSDYILIKSQQMIDLLDLSTKREETSIFIL